MKGQRIISLLLALVFVLLVAGYAAGFSAYREYEKRVSAFSRQDSFIEGKISVLEKNFGNSKMNLDNLDSEVKRYNKRLITVENVVKSGVVERKNFLSRMRDIKKDIRTLKKEHKSALEELGKKIEDLEYNVELSRIEEPKEEILDEALAEEIEK